MVGLFSSSGARKRNGAGLEQSIEEQLQEMRDDIAALASVLTDRGAAVSKDAKGKARDLREQTEAGLQDLLSNAEEILSELRSRYSGTERQVREAVREHPVATLGVAAALGLLVAALLRR
ncbi:hypothetical protein PYH37_005001 [Sinorhizobium numidicum]|uniref:DUF883 domain-containing protein n=1 Tax=Sinorhizobium numidicum TaxID=680248 RepID=A0ABY8CXG1_9HYPH|nr:hypothetical protein [Sinorhizobium numidicum]WEX76678.1 hypothetical protein PYH37_005001 [Sinorhizobium numidicum]WEX83339.1 hypothetical protein PYH38_005713 [Sinorhizobium numidicum]